MLQVAGCVPAGTAVAVAHARARLGCCSQSQALFEHEPEHHLHSVVAPVPTFTWAHLLLQQHSSPVFPPPVSSKCLGSFPPQLGVIPSDLLLQGWPPDTHWATQMFSFPSFSLLSTSNQMQWLRVSKVGIDIRGQVGKGCCEVLRCSDLN